MITLCGMSLSNYYNKVKIVLLEKGIPFTEEVVRTGSKVDAVLDATPLGKIPFIKVDGQTLCESQVIVDFLEARFPEHADKFFLVREFSGISDKRQGIDVPDPIGMGPAAYEEVAKVLDAAIPAIIAYVDSVGAK